MRKLIALIPFLALGLATYAQADIAGQVEVKLKVGSGCTVDNSTVSGNMNDFGDLDFGETSTTWSNVLTAEVQSSGTGDALTVSCDTDNTPFNVTIDGGLLGTRDMKHVTTSDLVSYSVYRDAARTNEYAIGTAQAFTTGAATIPTAVPIYGAVPANSTAVSTGDYTDTLLVNVSF